MGNIKSWALDQVPKGGHKGESPKLREYFVDSIEWRFDKELIPYEQAVAFMERRALAIRNGIEPELVWFLEHPPLYTCGASGNMADVLNRRGASGKMADVLNRGGTGDKSEDASGASDLTSNVLKAEPIPVYESRRGGKVTYHGPGQRVVYVLLDLKKRSQAIGGSTNGDVRAYVKALEQWIINSLAQFDIWGQRRADRIGIWVEEGRPKVGDQSEPAKFTTENKIAAIGVRIQKWVSSHGIAINVNPDLEAFKGIIPCGIQDHGVTSLQKMGVNLGMDEVDRVLRGEFEKVFGIG